MIFHINIWCSPQVAIVSATPVDDAGRSGNYMMDAPEPFAKYVGPSRTDGRMYGSLDFNDVSTMLYFSYIALKNIPVNLPPHPSFPYGLLTGGAVLFGNLILTWWYLGLFAIADVTCKAVMHTNN